MPKELSNAARMKKQRVEEYQSGKQAENVVKAWYAKA